MQNERACYNFMEYTIKLYFYKELELEHNGRAEEMYLESKTC